jgi:hypothetical protein
VISVRVEDWTDADDRAQPVGKQGGAWYTRVSGIWQTVYLEQRPPVHLTGVRIVPDLAAGAVEVTPAFDGSAAVTLTAKLDGDVVGEASADGAASTISLPLDVVSPWDVDHPTLYDLDVSVTDGGRTDVVHSYFGLSRPATDWIPGRSPDDTEDPAEQGRAFTFNGEPIYPRCVLDQSYWPDGLYTAPSLDDIRADLEAARAFGFNCIRLHIKPDEPVKLRLIDELGFYLVYDAPCLDMQAENGPGFVGREHFAADLDALVERDAGHPSLLLWVVFNENWGLSADGSLISPTPLADDPEMQGWVRQMVDRARDLDPARPVEDNSAGGVVGVFEHLSTDSNSFHNYDDDPSGWREFLADQDAATYPGSTANYVGGEVQDGAVWWNSEFASFSFLGSADEAFCDLFGALNELRRVPRLAGWVLTQLTDVEFEDNGLLTYDREAKDDLCERHGVALGDLLGDDFVGFDWLPGEALSSGEEVAVPLWFSQWSTGGATSRTLTLRWGDGQGTSFPFTPQPWTVTAIGGVTVTTPTEAGEHVLVAEVWDGSERICANRISVGLE